MLSRKNRISKKEFPSPKAKGARFFSTSFSTTIYTGKDQTLFSIVVSKKISKKALDRNHLKRQFYSLAEKHLKTIIKGVKIVIYPKKEALKTPFLLLQKELSTVLKTAKLIP